MKPLCTTLAIALASILPALCALAVPRRWEADVSRPGAFQASAYRGETVALEARLVDGGRPFAVPAGATARMLVSTNDFRDGCWEWPAEVTTGGVVRATWTPDMDPGAPAVRIFLGVSEGGTNLNYGANLTLRLLGSPGPEPHALPLPVPTIDFAAVAALNAPWATPADVAAATNGILRAEEDPLFSGWADGPAGTNGLLRLDENNYLDLPGAEVVFGGVTAGAFNAAGGWNDFSISGQDPRGGNLGDVLDMIEAGIPDLSNYYGDINTGGHITAGSMDIQGVRVATADDLAGLAAEEDLGTAAFRDASDFATRADEQLLAQLVMGSNVVFEVTNYNSRVRAPAARILQLSESNEYFQVWAETNGLARTLAAATAYADSLATDYAPRAWSGTTSGMGAEAPAGTTWISTPTTVVAGGHEYAKVVHAGGEAWVLCATDAALAPASNGFFRVETADGEPLVSIERTESVLVGVDAAGITVQGNTVTIPVPVVSQDPPVCYAARALTGAAWADLSESTPDWIDSAACTGSSGAWVWTIETDAPRAFFQFRVLQPGATVIRHHGWTDLSEGVIVNGVRYVPTTSGDTLTFTKASGQ